MIALLLQSKVQKFILDHEQDDEKKLVLKHNAIHGIPSSFIADQIAGRRKAKTKLPLYYRSKNILYPPGLNLEQSSSEETALFKAKILSSVLSHDKTLADLTGGFGVDSFFMSSVFQKVMCVEPNASLLSIAQNNHDALQAKNIEHHNTTAEEFLRSYTGNFDCIFIDPSRRNKANQKVFRLSDCEPNIVILLPEIFQRSNTVLIKTSPLLDIVHGLKELQHVEKVFVVSVANECKELLFFCRNAFEGDPIIMTVNLQEGQDNFEFQLGGEKSVSSKFSEPLTYLYEPNASILKAGAFKLIGKKFLLFKLNPSTHLYTSEDLIQNFPGRIFKTINSVKPDSKSLREIFPEGKANVITRNYPLSAEELKKKTKLKDGGDLYLLGFSGQSEKYLIAAQRIK